MPNLTAAISEAAATFITHDDDKDNDTTVDVYVDNQISMFLTVAVASKVSAFRGVTFPDNPSSRADLQLDINSPNLTLGQLQVPVWRIKMHPTGNDRWIFDVDIKLLFADGTMVHGTRGGLILDQNNNQTSGVMGF